MSRIASALTLVWPPRESRLWFAEKPGEARGRNLLLALGAAALVVLAVTS